MLSPTDRRQKLFRAIAILFLLYTGADLLAPQICAEERGLTTIEANDLLATTPPLPSYVSTVASEIPKKEHNQPPDQEQRDEDCFCCCAHVIPGSVFQGSSISEIVSISLPTKQALVQLQLPKAYFHPPRFA
jgi:hypothetical protein